MSWNNIIPWSFFYRGDHHIRALETCAFTNEVQVSDFRDDWCNRFTVYDVNASPKTTKTTREDW